MGKEKVTRAHTRTHMCAHTTHIYTHVHTRVYTHHTHMYTHRLEYSAMKREGDLGTTCMDFEGILLSELRQKDEYHMSSHI